MSDPGLVLDIVLDYAIVVVFLRGAVALVGDVGRARRALRTWRRWRAFS